MWGRHRLANYLSGVGLGLAHLHSLQVVHGDASLKNMLLMRSDQVAVADFGTAHSAHGHFLRPELNTLGPAAATLALAPPPSRPRLLLTSTVASSNARLFQITRKNKYDFK